MSEINQSSNKQTLSARLFKNPAGWVFLLSLTAAYFAGQLQAFTVPLHTPGTAFQQAAWKILRDIPYGETRSYKQQAIALGNPRAVRAVAAANGQNRVSIAIPYHRVIGSDGSLTGYGGGLDRKKWLLDFEKARGVQISLFGA